MANCKFCGGKVDVSPVWHQECWEEQAAKIANEICLSHCRFPEMYPNRELLRERHCDSCLLQELLQLGDS